MFGGQALGWMGRSIDLDARRLCALRAPPHRSGNTGSAPTLPHVAPKGTTAFGGRESLDGAGWGLPPDGMSHRRLPPPQDCGPDSIPKAVPYPYTSPNRISNRQ